MSHFAAWPGEGAGRPDRGPYLGAGSQPLALQSEVIGAARLRPRCDGIVCLTATTYVRDYPGRRHDTGYASCSLLPRNGWPHPNRTGCVLNPFAIDPDRELRLLRRKFECGCNLRSYPDVFQHPRC